MLSITGKILRSSVLALSVISTMFVVSCRSDDDDKKVTYLEESHILNGFLNNSGFNQTSANFVNSGNYEFGLAFTPKVKGKINSFTVKIPDANSNLRITVWNYETKEVIKSEVLNVTASGAVVTKSVTGIELQKGIKYLLTMNSADWYKAAKTDNSKIVYPLTIGNIEFNDYLWGTSTVSEFKFPGNISKDYYAGDVDFTFQQID